MQYFIAFFRFWYHFIVGDDWTIAVSVVIGLAATFWLVHSGANGWWLMPAVAIATLALAVWRAAT